MGVEQRGRYYDHAGALRDMVPNHLFQLLSLTAMEPPSSFEAEAVRDEKGKVLRAIQPFTPEEVLVRTVRGQYGGAPIPEHPAQAYRSEPHVEPQSNTETFVAMKLEIDNWRWADVPFYLRTGKRLPHHRTGRHDHVPATAPSPLPGHGRRGLRARTSSCSTSSRTRESRSTFQAKVPGPVVKTASVEMDFNYADHFGKHTEHRLRDAALRLHVRRPDALPARGQRGGRLEHRGSHPRRLEGAPRARVSELRAGNVGTERGRRAPGPGWPGLAASRALTTRLRRPGLRAAGRATLSARGRGGR